METQCILKQTPTADVNTVINELTRKLPRLRVSTAAADAAQSANEAVNRMVVTNQGSETLIM